MVWHRKCHKQVSSRWKKNAKNIYWKLVSSKKTSAQNRQKLTPMSTLAQPPLIVWTHNKF